MIGIINGHMRLIYPIPRSEFLGIKTGPCGEQRFDVGEWTELEHVSIVTVIIQEAIHHVGAPYRIALSHLKEDYYEDCILLDHIPQHNFETRLKKKLRATRFNFSAPEFNAEVKTISIDINAKFDLF